MQRRELLRQAGRGLTWGAALGSWGQMLHAAPQAPRFLFVFLRGGLDAASLLVPTGSAFYREARPDIALARPSADAASAMALNADWGLHPALRESLGPMWQRGELAFVPFCGTDDASRSHFETQDSIELGQFNAARISYGSGFLNRLAAALQGGATPVRPMAFTEQLPLCLQGSVPVANTGLKRLARPALDARQSQIVASMYRSSALQASVQNGFELREQVMREMAAEMEAAGRGALSARGFELEAQRIGRLMREQFALGFVDVGGWDTHVAQGAATGYLASRLDELGRGLAALSQEIGPAWARTVVVVMSEFGRTFRQNGNRGTDHGHGSVMWVMGGAVRGGQVVGEQVQLSPASLFQGRDLPVLNEYRSVLAGLFQRQWGLGTAQLQAVFPGSAGPRDWGLV